MKAGLLNLQDEGFEVNILLTLLWVGKGQQVISPAQLDALLERSRLSIMTKFREVRRLIKEDDIFSACYQGMLGLELKLEQKEIAHYYLQLTQFTLILSGDNAVQENLEIYSELLNKKPSDGFQQLLECLPFK